MDFELTDSDVEKNISRIVESMSRIRGEALKDSSLSDEQKDEYMHLTCRLASSVEPLASDTTTSRMNNLAKMMNKDNNLLFYDPLQDAYWRKKKPKFKKTLELAAIGSLRDGITSIEEEHHVLQAIKYLAVHDSDRAEKERVYATILPYHGARQFEESLADRLIGRLFGSTFEAESDGTVLKLKEPVDLEILRDIIAHSRRLGYTAVQFPAEQACIEKAKSMGGSVKGKSETVNKNALRNFGKFVRFKPLSYPVLGMLSDGAKTEIQGYFGGDKFDAEDATIVSWLFDIGTGVALMTYGLWGESNYYIAGAGGYFLANAVVIPSIAGKVDNPGNLHGKIISPLVSRYLSKRAARDFYDIEIPLASYEIKPAFNAPSRFREIAQTSAGDDAEKSIAAGPGNFHSYGKSFKAFLDALEKASGKSVDDVKHVVDRISGSYSLVHKHDIGGYSKYSHLLCVPNRRYLFSAVAEKNYDPSDVAGALLNDTNEKAKLEKLSKGVAFARLWRYDNNALSADLESYGD